MREPPSPENQPLFRPEAVEAASARFGAPAKPVNLRTWVLTIFLVTILGVAGAFLAIARYARKEAVIGVVEPSAGALRIVSPKSGVIANVEVAEGQVVAAGTPLIHLKLDPTTESGRPLGSLLAAGTGAEGRALEDELTAHRSSTVRQDQELKAKRDGLITHQARIEVDLDLAKQRLHLQDQSLESFRTLNEKKIISDLQYRDRQDAVLQAQQAISALEKDREDTTSSLAQLDVERDRIFEDLKESEAQNRSSHAQLDEKRAANSTDTEIVLTAPTSGRVVALQAKLGAPVAAATALAIILPEHSELNVQLWAPSKAAGFVRPGDPVRLMFDAFPYQKFGVGRGTVQAVANAPTSPNELPTPIETKEPLYRIDVVLKRQTVEGYGRSWPLSPGMRLTADLILDQRSFLEWIFDPLIAAAKRNGA